MRYVVFDTETTGFSTRGGINADRVVEFGAVEIIDDVITGNTLRFLINPERPIPAATTAVHGITDKDVADAPIFKQVLPEILDFIRGATLVAHNADFDIGMLSNEMKIAEHPETFWNVVTDVEDTQPLSRRLWPEKGVKHSLDAVCQRLSVDLSKRTSHGALLDSQLLAEAFLKMSTMKKDFGPTLEDDVIRTPPRKLENISVTAVPPLRSFARRP